MKSLHRISSIALGATALVFAATPVNALVVEQSQELNISTKTTSEGSSSVKSTSEANAWGKQTQSVSTEEHSYTYRHGHRSAWVRPMADGEVRLNWELRGGTCHVRYTEAGAKGYNYYTSTNCDDGEITIGGLVRGKAYRFQVRKDDGVWTKAVTVRSW
jgi:hypothetical protein